MADITYTIDFQHLGMGDLERVGGKNASLGEMISELSDVGVHVPGGFATTADAFHEFLEQGTLRSDIKTALDGLDIDDVTTLARVGAHIRHLMLNTRFSPAFEAAVQTAYHAMQAAVGHDDFTVAVRSSATAEDLPDASFAGQQETLLNVKGIDAILTAMKTIVPLLIKTTSPFFNSLIKRTFYTA